MLKELISNPEDGVFDFPFVEGAFYSLSLSRGSYLLEVWGASGGNQSAGKARQLIGIGGKGGYSRGVLNVLKDKTLLFVFVGGSGPTHSLIDEVVSNGGFNGGGASLGRNIGSGGGSGGGGSTDICTCKSDLVLTNGTTIRTEASYKSRIIVGGGGGGGWGRLKDLSSRILSYGGNGGGAVSGGSGYQQSYGCSISQCDNLVQGDEQQISYNYVTGSSQTSTGSKGCIKGDNNMLNGANQGFFGYGGSSTKTASNTGGGGGGGWFGGYSGSNGNNHIGTGGAGGSGYVHSATNAFSALDSSYFLRDAFLLDGSSSFPNPYNKFQNETGHNGNGHARITILSIQKRNHFTCEFHPFSCINHLLISFVLMPK